ncbi:MAG TPA: TrmH family RNA methyltransferase [Candidatus Binatia bacterium]|nr:TrmH family RNA methyltransferase [Candidatus Binatia bacterium]
MTTEILAQVRAAQRARVVLLEPKRGANVGAVCRAIKNMGAGELRIVGGRYDRDEARRTAVHAGDVFDARCEVATFDAAVEGCAVIIGTTSRQNPWHIPVEPVREVAQACARDLRRQDGRVLVAFVFGTEERGLSNAEAARCHRLASVPTAGEYASLNLSQAAVVCLYEWMMASSAAFAAADEPAADRARAADAGAVAGALADVEAMLGEIGFLEGDQARRVMATIASMLTRGGLDEREVRILRGIVRQVRWYARREQ